MRIANLRPHLFIASIIILLVTLPGYLSRSAMPHQTEILSQADQAQLFRFMMQDKVNKLDNLLNNYSWFNGNVLVVKNHQVLYERSQGYADFQTREPLNAQSVFELASVSKQFTAIAILMLYERNLLNLDDPLELFIPELPYRNITIRHLLNHTSGLPNYMWVLEHFWDKDHLPSNEEMIQMLAKHNTNMLFTPGRRHGYSNTGYAMLASVVERVSGITFTKFMYENIFRPLGMHNTYTCVEVLDANHNIPKVVKGHRQAWRTFRPNSPVVHDRVLGDKGIYSNLHDLYVWDQALYNEQLISNSTLIQAYQALSLSNRRTLPYGFGFRLGSRNDQEYVYHHGRWEGFRTSFFRYIENGNAIIILNNTNQDFNNHIIRCIEDVLDEPAELNPTLRVAFAIVSDGFDEGMDLFRLMQQKKEIQIPDIELLFSFNRLLRDINKPLLAARIYRFYETVFSPASSELPVALIE